MLTIWDHGTPLCDGLTRRQWLQIGGLAAFGLKSPGLSSPVNAQTTAGPKRKKARACIVLFMFGGPPQHETWDPKPDAPVEIRGDLRPIRSAVGGVLVGELMPRVARLTDRICILRGVSTNDNAHSSSGYWMLTGYPHQPTNSENAKPGAPNDWPSLGAVVRHLRERADNGSADLPATVTLPEHLWNTGGIVWPGQDAGWLGRGADPWLLHCDPSRNDFQVPGLDFQTDLPPIRFDVRRSLLTQVNSHLDKVQQSPTLTRYTRQSMQALDLLCSPRGRRAFRLEEETPVIRDRYGRNRFGQSVLLARRLVEAGVSLVQVNWTRSATDTNEAPVWDTHQKNKERLQNALMPPMDQAYSALLEDLAQRGLFDDTLTVWMGEFGRSPKINAAGGRDHWGRVFSVALAGGGIRGGQVYGSSDRIGAEPREGRVEPHDLAATVLHCLGYDPTVELRDALSRPVRLSTGKVLRQIF